MLAKWLEMHPDLLIFDEPTRGIDVGAKAEVHDLIRDFAARGGAVIVISSDLPEVLAMGDRVLVMREGRQMGIIPHEQAGLGRHHAAGDGHGGMSRISPQTLRLIALLAVLALVLAFFSTQIENYFNPRLFNRISSSVAIMALIATAQTLVILTRNIDLSIGSVVGFTAFATGSLVTNNPDIAPLLLVGYAMAIGAGFGAVNGLLVAYARIPSIIVTLATMALFRSLLVEYSDAKSITTDTLPTWLTDFPNIPLFQIAGCGVPRGLRHRRGDRAGGPPSTHPPAPRKAAVCRGVEPRGGGNGGDQPARSGVQRLCAGGRAGGTGRVHVPRPLRQHHRGRGAGVRAEIGGGGGCGRGQHLWRVRAPSSAR